MKKSEILYQLSVEDFQNVALEKLGRELNSEELGKVAEWVADRIPWYDLIDEGIADTLSA